MENVIVTRNISKVYSNGCTEVRALSDVSLTVEKGSFTAIVGKSGSGKSTLMNILGCLDTPTSGEYLLEGESVSTLREGQLSYIRNRVIGFIFQSFNLIPTMTALENVELPLVYRKIDKHRRHELARNALDLVGLAHRLNHRPYELSGGQQQRVAIARAVAAEPSLLLADEPTGNLDISSGTDIMNILSSLNADGRTVVLITHDPSIAERAKRQIEICDGQIVHEN